MPQMMNSYYSTYSGCGCYTCTTSSPVPRERYDLCLIFCFIAICAVLPLHRECDYRLLVAPSVSQFAPFCLSSFAPLALHVKLRPKQAAAAQKAQGGSDDEENDDDNENAAEEEPEAPADEAKPASSKQSKKSKAGKVMFFVLYCNNFVNL